MKKDKQPAEHEQQQQSAQVEQTELEKALTEENEKLIAEVERLTEQNAKLHNTLHSLATTDVLAVHSGYARYRKPLLEGGVRLWELRKRAGQQERASAFLGESLASLHAKAFFIDRQRTFVGSMNLDPRSILINTEIGVLVDNPVMTCEAIDDITHELMDHAFEVRLDKRKKLIWVLQEEGEEVTFHSEPLASIWQRLGAWLMGLLPLESQL